MFRIFLLLLVGLFFINSGFAETCNSQGAGGKLCCYCAYDQSADSLCASYQDFGACTLNFHQRCQWNLFTDSCESEFGAYCNQWFTSAGCYATHTEAVASGNMADAFSAIAGQANGGFPGNVTCGFSKFSWIGHSVPSDAKQLGRIGTVLANKTRACQIEVLSEGCETLGQVCNSSVGNKIAEGVQDAISAYPLPLNSSYTYIGNQMPTDRNINIPNHVGAILYGAPCSYMAIQSQMSQGNYSSLGSPWFQPCTVGQGCAEEGIGRTVNCRNGWSPAQQTCCPAYPINKYVLGTSCP